MSKRSDFNKREKSEKQQSDELIIKDDESPKKPDELIIENYGLAGYVVKQFHVSNFHDEEDIKSTGILGLIKAAKNFDENKGTKFSTYAVPSIRNEILMYLRKNKAHKNDISLETIIHEDDSGNTMTIGDKVLVSDENVTDKIIQGEIFIKCISIMLNFLEPRERYIILSEIAGVTQKVISEKLNLSQSYVSRLVKKIKEEIICYVSTIKQFKKAFLFEIVPDDFYQISFVLKDTDNIEKIWQNLSTIEDFLDFKISCYNKYITIRIPGNLESFFFFVQIIQGIDDDSLEFVSDKNK